MVLNSEQPLLGPDGHSKGHTMAVVAAGGLRMVVVSGRNVVGQCY